MALFKRKSDREKLREKLEGLQSQAKTQELANQRGISVKEAKRLQKAEVKHDARVNQLRLRGLTREEATQLQNLKEARNRRIKQTIAKDARIVKNVSTKAVSRVSKILNSPPPKRRRAPARRSAPRRAAPKKRPRRAAPKKRGRKTTRRRKKKSTGIVGFGGF